jgi:putative transposase
MFVDRLIAKTAAAPSRKRANMRRAQARGRDRIRWLVREVHCKAARFFATEFDVIALPAFGSGRMSERFGRKIHCKTVRQMLGWNQYKFRQRLVSKAEELGKVVIHPSEAYTTKTCCKCGWQNLTIGSSKTFQCRTEAGGCGQRIDRDLNSAVNIYLRSAAEGHFDYEREE